MSKKILECPYCKSIININDTICPKCGADCNSVIKNYHKEQDELQNKYKESFQKTMDEANKSITKVYKTIIYSTVVVLIIIMRLEISIISYHLF